MRTDTDFATETMLGEQMQHCVESCNSCQATCLETITYCLNTGQEYAESGHIRLLMDCVDMCRTSASFMLRASPMHELTCSLCADVCERCTESCEQFNGDPAMERCAEACRQCAMTCREMAGI